MNTIEGLDDKPDVQVEKPQQLNTIEGIEPLKIEGLEAAKPATPAPDLLPGGGFAAIPADEQPVETPTGDQPGVGRALKAAPEQFKLGAESYYSSFSYAQAQDHLNELDKAEDQIK